MKWAATRWRDTDRQDCADEIHRREHKHERGGPLERQLCEQRHKDQQTRRQKHYHRNNCAADHMRRGRAQQIDDEIDRPRHVDKQSP